MKKLYTLLLSLLSLQCLLAQTSSEEITLRLRRMPTIIEMPYNEAVREYIDRYVEKQPKNVAQLLGECNFYMPLFEEALDSFGLPLELRYLPIVESELKPKARSRAGAVGLWQFMMPTARHYGLEINSLIDERQDPIKSSYAAARYLKDLYAEYGDWNLVIAAYNCGPGNVNKAIQRADGARDYWVIYNYLPRETRGYVPAFIAANYAMTYYCEHGIEPVLPEDFPLNTDTVMISQDLHINQIEGVLGLSHETIKALNPQYRTSIIPGTYKPCTLRLPAEYVTDFIAKSDSIYAFNAAKLLTKRSRVDIPKASSSKAKAKYVTVRNGDTLGEIAKRNGTTVAKIRKLNGLRNNNIRVGRKLRVR